MNSTRADQPAVQPEQRPIAMWLFSLAAMVFLMVVIGGVTRLTRSGLSITEWKPISGIVPPLSEAAWEQEFLRYKNYPEYQKINRGMSLAEFKGIYFWEYVHRLWGRLIGLAFAVPFFVFLLRGRLRGALFWKTLLAFILGGAQGALGWYMVKSGLVNEPRVSHYRLAAHLLLAIFVMQYLFWIAHRLLYPPASTATRAQTALARFGALFMAVLFVQLLWGAFTAGLRAGYGYNTFPMMGNVWIPAEWMQLSPWWSNLFENGAAVQFVHRVGAWLVALVAIVWWALALRTSLTRRTRIAMHLMLLAVVAQFWLGVFTLLLVVPVGLGVLHQGGAAVLVCAATHALLELSRGEAR